MSDEALTVAVIREVTPDEAGRVHAECMTQAGWPASVDEFGVVDYSFPLEQETSFNQGYATCLGQYPIEAKYTVPLTLAQYGVIYDHLVKETIPCLSDLGYEVETPPTRDVYIATAESADVYLVNKAIYDEVVDDVDTGRWVSPDEVFQQVCPILPPDGVLYRH